MKFTALTPPLYEYLASHQPLAADSLLARLREETNALGDDARMQISVEQGALLTLLTRIIGARAAIEVGTFTGYSSLCIARGLPADGRLCCLDASEQWTEIARRYWKQANLQDRIELLLGPAIPSLTALEPGRMFDLAFIDADKTEYDIYFELLLPHVRSNGLVILDNMLWSGRVVDPAAADDPTTRAVRALNDKLANDHRIDAVLLPVADGLQICRKK